MVTRGSLKKKKKEQTFELFLPLGNKRNYSWIPKHRVLFTHLMTNAQNHT